jgi:hypothetical protein
MRRFTDRRADESVAGVTRAKIVATLGPASASPQKIHQLVDAGSDEPDRSPSPAAQRSCHR